MDPRPLGNRCKRRFVCGLHGGVEGTGGVTNGKLCFLIPTITYQAHPEMTRNHHHKSIQIELQKQFLTIDGHKKNTKDGTRAQPPLSTSYTRNNEGLRG